MRSDVAIKSFLRQHNLRGKTVIPFNTNAGYGEGSSFRSVREVCSQCTVAEGFVTRGGVERDGQNFVIHGARAEQARKDVQSWLRKIGGPVDSPALLVIAEQRIADLKAAVE